MERDLKYATRYRITVLIRMHEPHLIGFRRITHFVRVEVVVGIQDIKRTQNSSENTYQIDDMHSEINWNHEGVKIRFPS